MKPPKSLRRRDFLQTTSGLLTGFLAAGSPLALVAPGRAWALELKALTSSEGRSLLAASRTIAPHDKLDDAAYALVIQALDEEAARDEKIRKVLKEGIGNLGSGFATEREGNRVQALRRVESSEFFQTVRSRTLQVLYDTPMAYTCFGYEGEAFSKGGYLLRGFNNLRWLPEVPEEDSGPLPVRAQKSVRGG
jgi:hypothetical protein